MCWNWQTRWTQNPLVATPCGFDPRHRQKEKDAKASFSFCRYSTGVERGKSHPVRATKCESICPVDIVFTCAYVCRAERETGGRKGEVASGTGDQMRKHLPRGYSLYVRLRLQSGARGFTLSGKDKVHEPPAPQNSRRYMPSGVFLYKTRRRCYSHHRLIIL